MNSVLRILGECWQKYQSLQLAVIPTVRRPMILRRVPNTSITFQVVSACYCSDRNLIKDESCRRLMMVNVSSLAVLESGRAIHSAAVARNGDNDFEDMFEDILLI